MRAWSQHGFLPLSGVERYLIFGAAQVEGWLHPYSAKLIHLLAQIQTMAGFRGAVGEIGVYHGKLLILLLLCKLDTEPAFAIDIFERQDLNVDDSGRGDLHRLRDNVRRWTSGKELTLIGKSSLEVGPLEILNRCGRVRLASIDGGHTSDCAYNDLVLIDKVLAEYGVVILDDYFNSQWPDVSTGTARYLLDTSSTLRPFAISPNKVYLSRPEYSMLYRKGIAATQIGHPKSSRMFNSDVDIYGAPPFLPPIGTCLRELLKRSPIGPYILAAKTVLAKPRADAIDSRQAGRDESTHA